MSKFFNTLMNRTHSLAVGSYLQGVFNSVFMPEIKSVGSISFLF